MKKYKEPKAVQKSVDLICYHNNPKLKRSVQISYAVVTVSLSLWKVVHLIYYRNSQKLWRRVYILYA